MARFKYTDNSQGMFLTVNLNEQLIPGTFEWTLDYLIDRMDLSLYEQNYHNDVKGACAYPPKVLLKIIFYSYSKGILSSRPMEKLCRDNMTAKALAENCEPDHDTIAAFISTNHEAVKDLFTQILMQCDKLDLITGEMFGIDGVKVPSNASKEWSGTIEGLKKKKAAGGKSRFRTLYIVTRKHEENLSEKMRKKIDDPAYREIYSRRQQIIEPVFSEITYCKGMNRFTLRGTEKVDAQWKMYCIVHNIGKCIRALGKKCRV